MVDGASEIPTRAGVLTARPVADLTADQAAEAMTRSFEGYLVPLSMDGPAFERRFGATPAYRGRGIGRALMERAVARCAAAGATTMTLEVIVGNEAAQRLYENLGFRVARTLIGYRWEPPATAPQLPPSSPLRLVEIDPVRFARGVAAGLAADPGGGDPPWQLAPETLAAAVPPRRAYALGLASALGGFLRRDRLGSR